MDVVINYKINWRKNIHGSILGREDFHVITDIAE